MTNDADIQDWIDEQLATHGWSDEEIAHGKKYNKGLVYGGLGGLLCVFLITIPIGLPLFAFGIYRAMRYRTPGDAYREAKEELEAEHERRNERGDALWADVDGEWFEERVPSHHG